MKKAILIINANLEAARAIERNLDSLNTEIVCVASMDDALQAFFKTDFCLIILDASISAADDHQLLKAMGKVRTTPILILSSQSCHIERLKVFQAGAHAYISEPYSLEEAVSHGSGRGARQNDGHPLADQICGTGQRLRQLAPPSAEQRQAA